MVDETATTFLKIDATGAQKGAQDFTVAGRAVIAVEAELEAAAAKAAAAVLASKLKEARAREDAARAAAKSAKDAVTAEEGLELVEARLEASRIGREAARARRAQKDAEERARLARDDVAVTAATGEAFAAATDRIVKSASVQIQSLKSVKTAADELAVSWGRMAAMDKEIASRSRGIGQAAFNARTGVGGNPLYGEEYAGRQAELQAYGNELDKLRAKYNPLFAASKQYEADLAGISRALAIGAINTAEAEAATERLTAAYAAQNPAAREMLTTTTALNAAKTQALALDREIAAADAASASRSRGLGQAAFNARTGFGGNPLYGEEYAGRQAELQAYGNELDKLRAKYNPLFAASKQYEADLAGISRALAIGAINTAEAEAATERLTAAYAAQNPAAREMLTTTTALNAAKTQALALDREIAAADAASASRSRGLGQAAFNARTGFGGNPLYGEEYAGRQAELQAYGNELDKLRAKYNPLFAASKQYEADLAGISRALAIGAINTAEAEAATERLTAAYAAQNPAAREMLTTTTALNAAKTQALALDREIAAVDAAAANRSRGLGQAAFNARTGVGGNPLYGAARDEREGGIASAFSDADAGRASVDKLFAASKAYEKQLEALNHQLAIGNITTQRHAVLQDELNKSFAGATIMTARLDANMGSMARSTRANSFAVQQLFVQTSQGVSGLMTGQDFFTVFIQQGHQVVDVALATGTGFKVLGDAIKSSLGWLISPTGLQLLGATALVGGIAAVSYAAESGARRLGALSNQLSLIRSDYVSTARAADDAAKRLASTTFLTTAESRTGVNAALQAGVTDPTKASELTLLMGRLALRMGDVGQSTKMIGDASKDAAKWLEDLLNTNPQGLTEMDRGLLFIVKNLQQAQGNAAALDRVMEALRRQVKHGTDDLTPLEKALRGLENALTGSAQGGKSFAETLGTPFTALAANMVTALTSIVNALKPVAELFERVTTGVGNLITDGARLMAQPWVKAWEWAQQLPGAAMDAGAAGYRLMGPQAGARTIPSDIDPIIGAVAAKIGIDQNALRQLYRQEARRNPDGSWAVSSAGARGPMQVMPGTFAQVAGQYGLTGGIDDTGTNIQAGALYFRDLVKQFAAQGYGPDMAAGAYNMGPGSPGGKTGMFGVLAGNRSLPEETAKYIRDFQAGYGSSGGLTTALAPVRGGAIPVGGEQYGPPVRPPGMSLEDYRKRAKPALEGTTEAQRLKLEADLKAAEEVARTSTNPEEVRQAQQAIDNLKKSQYENVTATDLAIRTATIQVDAEKRMATAWDTSSEAVQRVTAQLAAEEAATQAVGRESARYAGLVADLTKKNLEKADSQALINSRQAALSTIDQIEMIRKEISIMGESYDKRQMILGQLKLEQELRGINITRDRNPEEFARRMALGATAVTEGLNLEKQKASLSALTDTFTSAFDTIGNAITSAFLTGNGAAINWKNVMNSVVTQVIQSVFKLGVLNPIMNSLFNTNKGTLGDLPASTGGGFLSSLSGLLSGGTSAMAGASSEALAAQMTAVVPIGHAGWHVGMEPPTSYRAVNSNVFANAPRFHGGLGGDEFAAILQKGERVLTGGQQRRMAAAANDDRSMSQVVNINLPQGADIDTFRRSGPSIMRHALDAQLRAKRRAGG